jgi:hypothetical protein
MWEMICCQVKQKVELPSTAGGGTVRFGDSDERESRRRGAEFRTRSSGGRRQLAHAPQRLARSEVILKTSD